LVVQDRDERPLGVAVRQAMLELGVLVSRQPRQRQHQRTSQNSNATGMLSMNSVSASRIVLNKNARTDVSDQTIDRTVPRGYWIGLVIASQCATSLASVESSRAPRLKSPPSLPRAPKIA